jgi:hypothetical protein
LWATVKTVPNITYTIPLDSHLIIPFIPRQKER